MKERLKYLWDMLSFRTMWEDQEEEDWEDYDQKDNYVSGEVYADDTKKLAGLGSGIVYLAIIALVVIAVAAYLIMSRFHLYTLPARVMRSWGTALSSTVRTAFHLSMGRMRPSGVLRTR